jgi:hypothetical protein
MKAYHIQHRNNWGGTEQQKNSGYFITSSATGINCPSELRATVQKAVEEQGATCVERNLFVRSPHCCFVTIA